MAHGKGDSVHLMLSWEMTIPFGVQDLAGIFQTLARKRTEMPRATSGCEQLRRVQHRQVLCLSGGRADGSGHGNVTTRDTLYQVTLTVFRGINRSRIIAEGSAVWGR